MHIAILAGGSSAEANVSRSSAKEIALALATHHEVKIFELTSGLTNKLLEYSPDVVFPALHGSPGEDGTVQGYLDILEIPYVGSGVHGSAIAMDKHATKQLLKFGGLPVLDHLIVEKTEHSINVSEIETTLGHNVVIKPLTEGSAIGVRRIKDEDDLSNSLSQSLEIHESVLIEPYFQGKEITVGILDLFGDPVTPLPVVEIVLPSNQWYSFENRYKKGASAHQIPPEDMDEHLLSKLQNLAISAHKLLGLQDLSRTDFLVNDTGEIALLEINSIPGMTPTSLFPDAAQAVGIDFISLVDQLVRSAWERAQASL